MNNIVGLGIFALGIVLLIFGFSESQAVNPELSRTVASQPVGSSLWMLIGGAVAVVGGLILALRGVKRE